MEIPNATKRYTARFTTDLRSSPGADAIPAAALPYKIPPKKTYPAVINNSVCLPKNRKGRQVGSRTPWSKERGGPYSGTEPYDARVSRTVPLRRV